MSIITSVFLIIVGFFLWRGYRQGFAKSLAQILSLAIAYPAAIFLTNPLAHFIFAHTAFTGMLVYFAAGSFIFFIVTFTVTNLLKRFAQTLPVNQFTVNGSKLGGAVIGVLVGGIVGLIAVYAIGLAQKFQTKQPDLSVQTSSNESLIEAISKTFVGTAVSTATQFALHDKIATHITEAFTQDPQAMLTHMQKLNNDGELRILITDPEIQSLLKKGDTQTLLKDWRFQHLMNNQDMQAMLINTEDNQSGKFSQQIAAENMVSAWRHTYAIKNDPRIVAIINDAEFQQQLNSPNKLPLMLNPKLKELTDIIFSSEHPVESIDPVAVPAAQIYRWTDSSGRVHYSDEPVKNNN